MQQVKTNILSTSYIHGKECLGRTANMYVAYVFAPISFQRTRYVNMLC